MFLFGKRLRWLTYFLVGLLSVLLVSFGFVVTQSATIAQPVQLTLSRSQLVARPEANLEAAASHLEPNFYQ